MTRWAGLLDEAGEERFRLKAGRFAAGIGEEPPGQVLYRGIMGAMGYTKNKEPFQELACRLPLATLEGCCKGKALEERVTVLRALLLGMAGLLPHDDEEGRAWCCLGDRKPMSPPRWRSIQGAP
jgi:hypothetical protein